MIEHPDTKVRVILGQFEEKTPNYELLTKVTLLHIFLAPQAQITLPAKEMAFVYGLKGEALGSDQSIKGQTLANYSPAGDKVTIAAGASGFEFLFGTGTPLNETITYGGPFVMTPPEQMAEARMRFAKGEMGKLASYQGK